MSKYIVYCLIDVNGIPRYIGQGTRKRLSHVKHKSRSKEYIEIKENGGSFEILYESESKTEVLEKEIELIAYYKELYPGCLINKTSKTVQKNIRYSDLVGKLLYDEKSPTCLIWNYDRQKSNGRLCSKARKGNQAGCILKTGYGLLVLDGVQLALHRVIYALVHKIDLDPNLVVNHKDSNPSNNRIDNLELITQKENISKALLVNRTNTGVRGVRLVKSKFGIPTYTATCVCPLTDKQISKSFSCKKYTESLAFEMAKNWRKEKLKEFYPDFYEKML